MQKKSGILFIFIICITFMFSSCSYVAYKDYYSDIDDYQTIWNLAGYRHNSNGTSYLFPEDISNLKVQDFYCRYDEQLPLGEGFQIFLKIEYDENTFYTELTRIAAMAFRCDEYFVDSDFYAYATRLGSVCVSEYVLIDETQKTMYYIYLQDIPKEEILFNSLYLPIGYTGYGGIVEKSESINDSAS